MDMIQSSNGLINLQNKYSALCVSYLQPKVDQTPKGKKVKTSEVPTAPKGKGLVVNMSSKTLSPDENNILNKGLKFCPTQKRTDPGTVRRELDNFHNKLRTKQFFERNKPASVNQDTTSVPTNQPQKNV